MPPPAQPRGLVSHEPRTTAGYVLFSPILSTTVFLIDNRGSVVHTWENEYGGISHYLGDDGTLLLNGDTGLSAAIKDDLTAIIGLPRAIPLFDQVSGPGNNAMFRIVGFAGIQIVEVTLTGPMNSKRVVIQPAFVVDPTAITGPGSPAFGDFVYEPVKLVR